MIFPTPEILDTAQVTSSLKKLLEEGVDGVKLHLQPSLLPDAPSLVSVIPTVVSQVHQLGKPVFVHPNIGADVLAAVQSGVEVIVHTTPGSGSWNKTIFTAMKERRVALTPTLTL